MPTFKLEKIIVINGAAIAIVFLLKYARRRRVSKNGEMKLKFGKYRHYKGNYYEALAIVKHSETLEDMILYKALYGEGGLWVRPLAMWNDVIDVNGQSVLRFEYVDER